MYLILTILGILFLFLDLIKKSEIKLILATSFLFSAIVCYKSPKYTIISFGIFFFINSILIKKIFDKEKEDINKSSKLTEYKNKVALVTKDIGKTLSIDGLGLIEFEGNQWNAKNIKDTEIKAGNYVKIVSKENMIMNVEEINASK